MNKYFFVQKTRNYYGLFGTSGAGFMIDTMDIQYDTQGYLIYPEPIKLGILGGEKETRLLFPKLEVLGTYLLTMLPELKSVLEQFNMPEHKWYKAEVGYNLEYINSRKKYFNIIHLS